MMDGVADAKLMLDGLRVWRYGVGYGVWGGVWGMGWGMRYGVGYGVVRIVTYMWVAVCVSQEEAWMYV